MSADSDHHHRPSFRFRDKFSRLKDRVKEKIHDKTIKRNVTLLVHQNFTSNDRQENYTDGSRHGFRQHMHHFKDVLKNKTHYASIKDKIKDKIDDKFDLHDNKTYPKGFYDSLFSPETENDVYLQTALICLWIIALLCIIPTIIVIFLPAKKTHKPATSINMIFFHIFLCELCYLTYVLLAMINVAKDFRLASLFCDFANYGMYVTIPIMQFALLFLSLERLSKRFNLAMTWAKIFTKPYLIQVILCVIWIILIALLVTFMFIKKQFSFNFIKDKAYSLAPPIFGDVVDKLAARRHHCSIDGRLSSVFKTLIIILFIILIVKPILFSLGFNILTPVCCKNKRKKDHEKQDDRRTTTLVTIFLLLNFFFSFPFYFASMFNSILTRIDSTKDTFTIILKICFILRITNIIFECLAFYIFERNSWDLLRKCFYYGTCKKCPIFKPSDDDVIYTKVPHVQDPVKRTRSHSDDDNDDEDDGDGEMTTKKKQIHKRKAVLSRESESEDEEDDDGGFRKAKKRESKTIKNETPVESDNDDDDDAKPVIKQRKQSNKKADEDEENQHTRRTSQIKNIENDEDDDDEEEEDKPRRKSKSKREKSANDDGDEIDTKHVVTTKKRKSHTKKPSTDEEEEQEIATTTKRKSRIIKPTSDNNDEEQETITITKRKSRPKIAAEKEIIRKPKKKVRQKVEQEVEEEEEEEKEKKIIKKPNTKSHENDVEIRVPNGKPNSHRPSSTTNKHKKITSTSSHNNIKRQSTPPSPSSAESDADKASNASHSSARMIKQSTSSKSIKKQPTKTRSSSNDQKRTRTISPNDKRSHHRTDPSPSSRSKPKELTSNHSHHTTKKQPHESSTKPKSSNTHTKQPKKKDHHTRILEMSDEV